MSQVWTTSTIYLKISFWTTQGEETEHLGCFESTNKKSNDNTGFELAIHNLQFAKHFSSLRMSFCSFSKNCESLKSDTSQIFRVIHWTAYIVSYFKPIKYPPVQ